MEGSLKDFVRQHLGKNAVKHVSEILLNVKSVDLGLKNCYLWDCSASTYDQIVAFIECLTQQKYICKNLLVLNVEECAFVCNREALMKFLKNGNCELIDASLNRNNLSIITGSEKDKILQPMVKLLVEKLENSEIGYSIVPGDNTNRSTLYGVLLGYPVVYWYSDILEANNCLSMEPLCVHKVICSSCLSSKQFMMYSFSFPLDLQGELLPKVTQWFECLRSKFDTLLELNEMKLSSDVVTLPAVAL